MRALIQLVWDVMRLKKGPEHMPYSVPLLALWLIMASVLSAVQLTQKETLGSALIQIAFLFILNAIFLYGVLYFFKKTPRFIQTLSTLMAIECFVLIAFFPVFLMQPYLQNAVLNPVLKYYAVLLAIVWIFILNIWRLIAVITIYQKTLEVSMPKAFLIVLALNVSIILAARFLLA